MSVSHIVSLRPLRGQCLRQARTGLLSLSITSRSASFNLQAIIRIPPHQGFQSTTTPSHNGEQGEKKPLPPQQQQQQQQPKGGKSDQPKMTFRQFWGRALTVSLRNLAYALSPRGVRQAYRDSPISTSFILALLAVTFVFGAIQIRLFYKTFYDEKWSKYPQPVANTLRRAIYNTTISPDPDLALKYYKRAMAEAHQIGMDPFSDEVLGIRIMVAFWLEKIDNYTQSAEVLEAVLRDCVEWVSVMERQDRGGNIDDGGRLKSLATAAPEAQQLVWTPSPEVVEHARAANDGQGIEIPDETLWKRRERLLAKAVSIAVKLGELYADEHVLEPESSHKHLVWSVETTLKEFKRRKEQGPKPGEESWLTPTEVGASMESLGRNYERKSQFHLAIPLFFQALRNCDTPCHRAVIMNNLSACFAQHPIYSPATGGSPETESLKDLFASSMPNTRADCLDAAVNWARNAYTHAKDVKGEERTPECDEACAVALCNWGDVAAMQGKRDLARKKYEQCIELSGKLDFAPGVKQAQDGLKRLTSQASK